VAVQIPLPSTQNQTKIPNLAYGRQAKISGFSGAGGWTISPVRP